MWKNTASLLIGSDRRQFMAKVVNVLGRGGQSYAEQILGWNRCTIRKGQAELVNGFPFKDRFNQRGRNKSETRLPNLLGDIRSIVEPASQTDPTFRSTRIYSPLSAEEVRRRLITQYGYKDTVITQRPDVTQQTQRPRVSFAQGPKMSSFEENP
ncbi:MAG: hypothetical protein AB7U29_05785 [Desulfobulbus sp.]